MARCHSEPLARKPNAVQTIAAERRRLVGASQEANRLYKLFWTNQNIVTIASTASAVSIYSYLSVAIGINLSIGGKHRPSASAVRTFPRSWAAADSSAGRDCPVSVRSARLEHR